MMMLSIFSPSGAAALATSVSAASPLELLDVNDNGIGPAGAASLAELLGTSPALRVLRMRGNRIGDEGAAALGHAIAEGPPLQELDVGGNQVMHHAPLSSLLFHAFLKGNKNCMWHADMQGFLLHS